MITDRSILENFRPCKESIQGIRGTTAILGRGNANLTVTIQGKQIALRLKNCAYIPTASNLISIPMINDSDGCVVFRKRKASCYDSNGDLFCVGIRREEGLYEVHPTSTQIQGGGHHEVYSASKRKARSWQEWHCAMGHVNFPSLQNLQKNNPTMVVKDPDNKEFTCPACDMGKATKNPHPKSLSETGHTIKIQKPSDQILMDTLGPLTPEGRKGMKYVVQNIDAKTRWQVSRPTTDKTQALKAFKEMETILELADSSNRVRSTLSDHGGEFDNDTFKAYTSKKGIIMNFAAPYNPATMGKIERPNRTLAEMTRTMILDSGLPKNLWPDIMIHATWIKNRVPHSGLNGKSPYEQLYKEIPDISNVPAIGAKIYVLDETGKPKKLDAKAAPFKFLGFDGATTKTIKYYHSPTRTVRTTRNWKVVPVAKSGGDGAQKGDLTPATLTPEDDTATWEFEIGHF